MTADVGSNRQRVAIVNLHPSSTGGLHLSCWRVSPSVMLARRGWSWPLNCQAYSFFSNSQAHQSLTEAERKKICSMMDSQRLSREACAHAAQNDRLPVQTVVQVLFYEQQRIRDSTPPNFIGGGDSPVPLHKSGYLSDHHDSTHELSRLKSENDSLKLELVRMRMQLKENGKPAPATKMASADKPPLPKKSFMSSVSKKLSQLYTFVRSETVKEQGEKTRMKPPKNRRYSIS